VTRGILTALISLLVVAGCGPGTTSTTSPPSPTQVAASASSSAASAPVPTSSTPVGTARPSPLAVQPGEAWIAFQWQRGPGDGIFLMRPDGGDSHPLLTASKPETFHPDWSPDGTQVAYEAAAGRADDIWLVDADGHHPTKLVDRSTDCIPLCGDAAYPAWSPDGGSMAFIRFDFDGDQLHGCVLEVVEVATGTRRIVYEGPASTVLDYPRWSPDGTSIVFEATTFPDPSLSKGKATGSTVAVVDAAKPGAKPDILTKPAMFATYPDWSSSGNLIVFSTYDLGEFQATDEPSNLYTIKPDGSDMSKLTSYGSAGQRATQPSWTPDGKRILFTLVGQDPSFDNPRQAAFIDADGSNLQVLSSSATHPRLRPAP
jgi:Tol biopolymer transport system component